MGYALFLAEQGRAHPSVRTLRGFKGARVLQISDDHDGDTYRTVYTARFPDAIYVLHAFKKKSKKGIETAKRDLDVIRQRLSRVEQLHKK